MNKLEIINVGNGDSNYKGNFVKKEIKIIESNIFGNTLHLFSGRSQIGNIRIDLYCNEATYNISVENFIEEYNEFSSGKINTVIIDSPYNEKFANLYDNYGKNLGNIIEESKQTILFASTKKTTNLFNWLNDVLKPERIIIKSWNYYILKEYQLTKGYLCYAGGYRKPTILLIMDRR